MRLLATFSNLFKLSLTSLFISFSPSSEYLCDIDVYFIWTSISTFWHTEHISCVSVWVHARVRACACVYVYEASHRKTVFGIECRRVFAWFPRESEVIMIHICKWSHTKIYATMAKLAWILKISIGHWSSPFRYSFLETGIALFYATARKAVIVMTFIAKFLKHLIRKLPKRSHIRISIYYPRTSNASCTLVGNKMVDHSDEVEASPFGVAPTASSLSV